MVLETRLVSISLTLLILFATACTANNATITDDARVNSYHLILKVVDGGCLLDSVYEGKTTTMPLAIKPPCYFLRRDSKEPQSFAYKDVNVIASLMIVGTPISNEKREKWSIGANDFCGESRQAVLIKKSGLYVSDKILEGGVVCKDKGADEKDFWYLAH